MLGDVPLERRFLDEWEADAGESVAVLFHRASFLMRQSAAREAVHAARQAVAASPASTPIRVIAVTYLAQALWSVGQPELAREELAACQRDEQRVLERDAEARVAVDHSFALVLHDLERNVEVVDHARRCVDAYRRDGKLEAELISRVNLGDALWGSGRLADALPVLEDAHEHAEAAGLPHARDIAAICLANALATAGQRDRALELYDGGIELATEIGHEWDELYGRAHRALCVADYGDPVDSEELLALADRARRSRHPYLASLALANAPLAAYLAGNVGESKRVLGVVNTRCVPLRAPGPAAQLLVLQVAAREQAKRSARDAARGGGRPLRGSKGPARARDRGARPSRASRGGEP